MGAASARMTDRLACSQFRRNCEHKTIKGFWGDDGVLIPFFGVIQRKSLGSEFECRKWSLVLIPDRPTRLICRGNAAVAAPFQGRCATCPCAGLGAQPSWRARISVNRLRKI